VQQYFIEDDEVRWRDSKDALEVRVCGPVRSWGNCRCPSRWSARPGAGCRW